LSADPTRTSRGDVIISFQPQIAFDTSLPTDPTTGLPYVTFTTSNWYVPQRIGVQAINNDGVIEGGDTKVFPQQLDLASNIAGPLFVQGGPGPDHSELTSREPILLPGETNFAPFPNAGTVRGVVAQLTPAALIGEAADITDANGLTTGTITIKASDA